MDRNQLSEALRAAGVPAGLYEVVGAPGGPWPVEHLYLEEQAGEWVVGVVKRGVREAVERFPDEDAACRSLYAQLTEQPPPTWPLTPEEQEEVLHHSEGIQRRAREELARALEAARQRPRGDAGPPDGRP